MPAVDLVSTFSVRTLTEAVRTFDSKATDSFFTALFREGRTINAEGRKAEWHEIRSSRALAPVTGLTSPTPLVEPIGRRERDSFMMRIAETRFLPWDKLFLDTHMGELKANARQAVMDELEDMTAEVQKTREYACGQVLQGGLTVNSTNIPGSDLAFSLSFGVATASKAAAWSTISTAIISDEIPKVQAAMVSNCGRPATRAIINDVTYRYLLANTEVTSYGKNQQWAENFLRANVVDPEVARGVRIGDLNWKSNAYGYKNDGGSFTRWMASDKVVFLPDDLKSVLALAQGKQAVPRRLWGTGGDVGIEEYNRGLVAYAKSTDDPCGVQLFVSDHLLPIVLFPEAVLYFSAV